MDSVKSPDWLYPLELTEPLDPNGPGCLGYPDPVEHAADGEHELVDYGELIDSEFDEIQQAAWEAMQNELDVLKDRLSDLLNERDELRDQVESRRSV